MEDTLAPQNIERLRDDEVIHRLARNKSWLDPNNPGKFQPLAFELRTNSEGIRERGLSINYDCTVQWLLENPPLKKMHGIASSDIASVRGLGLDVIPDEPPPKHGIITGVDDLKRATDLAYELAELFTVTWPK